MYPQIPAAPEFQTALGAHPTYSGVFGAETILQCLGFGDEESLVGSGLGAKEKVIRFWVEQKATLNCVLWIGTPSPHPYPHAHSRA